MSFLELVSREEWGAKPSKGDMDIVTHPVEYVIYNYSMDVPHCITDEECTKRVQDLQQKDFESGKPDIAYNFLIGGNGKIYEGRGWWHQSDPQLMFPEHNGNRIDIAYIGNYIKEIPEDHMILAADKLLTFAVDMDLVKPKYVERQIVIQEEKGKEKEKQEDKESVTNTQ